MEAPYVIQLSWVPRNMLRQIPAPPFWTADDDSVFCSVVEIHCKLEGHSNWAWRALTPKSWAHYRAAQEVSSRQWSWAYSNIRASVLSASLLAQMLLSLLWDSVFIQDQKNHTNYSKINKYHWLMQGHYSLLTAWHSCASPRRKNMVKLKSRVCYMSYRVRIKLYGCRIFAAADAAVSFHLAAEEFPPPVQLRVCPVALCLCRT